MPQFTAFMTLGMTDILPEVHIFASNLLVTTFSVYFLYLPNAVHYYVVSC